MHDLDFVADFNQANHIFVSTIRFETMMKVTEALYAVVQIAFASSRCVCRWNPYSQIISFQQYYLALLVMSHSMQTNNDKYLDYLNYSHSIVAGGFELTS